MNVHHYGQYTPCKGEWPFAPTPNPAETRELEARISENVSQLLG
jgi:hypothetical protein